MHYLLWVEEEVCSNSGQSERQFIFFSPAQWLGLSGPFVRIIIWLLTASQLKIKLVLHWFKAAEAPYKMAAADLNRITFKWWSILIVLIHGVTVCHPEVNILLRSQQEDYGLWGVLDRDIQNLCPPSLCSEWAVLLWFILRWSYHSCCICGGSLSKPLDTLSFPSLALGPGKTPFVRYPASSGIFILK